MPVPVKPGKAASRMKPSKQPRPSSSSSVPTSPSDPPQSQSQPPPSFIFANTISKAVDVSSSSKGTTSPPPPGAHLPSPWKKQPRKGGDPPASTNKSPPRTTSQDELFHKLFPDTRSTASDPNPAAPTTKKARPSSATSVFPSAPLPSGLARKPRPKHIEGSPPKKAHTGGPTKPATPKMMSPSMVPSMPRVVFDGGKRVRPRRPLPTLLPRASRSPPPVKGPVDGSGWRTVSLTAKGAIERRKELEKRRASIEIYVEQSESPSFESDLYPSISLSLSFQHASMF